MYQFGLPLIAVGLTSSPTAVAGVTVMLTLAWPVFGLVAGSIVDRADRRRVMLVVSAIRVGVLAFVTVTILTGTISMPVVYAAALILGVGETLVDTALTSIVPALVPADRLESANGRITAGQTVTNTFVGPPLAGALLGFGWAVVTSVAAVLYASAVIALALVRGSYRAAPEPVDARRPARRRANDLTEGLRALWRQPVLRRLTLFTAAMNVWWAAWTALIVLYALAPGPLGLTSFGYGVLLTAMAVGGVLGALVSARLVRAVGTRSALALDLVGTALLLGVPAVATHPILVGASVFVAGLGASVWVVLVASIRQRLTPDALLGRVYSASRVISWGALPLGATAAGIAAEFVGIRTVFGFGAIVSIGLIVAFLALVRASDLAGVPASGNGGRDQTRDARPETHEPEEEQPIAPDDPVELEGPVARNARVESPVTAKARTK
jgi:MFS family permease